MADVLTVVAKIRAAKGKGDALAALLKEQVAAVMKTEPGCIVYRPHRSTKDPDMFIFYEHGAPAVRVRAGYVALTRMKATRQGRSLRLLHAWLVARWTRQSPASSRVSPSSMRAQISPESTIA